VLEVEVRARSGPSPEAAAALDRAALVVIGPSNPLLSIGPIMAVLGDRLDPARTVAVSPIVAGEALKGPTVKMLTELGLPATPETVAEEYRGRAGWFVLDERDRDRAGAIEGLGYRVVVADTVMTDAAAGRRLAADILLATRAEL
jgi:LPPG:FO 2-phospho-L-lactate transferase